jgi:hypothetical protein
MSVLDINHHPKQMNSTTTRARRRLQPDLQFWGAFFILNALLFLPFYLLNIDESQLLPFLGMLGESPRQAFSGLFIWRENFDPFRLNAELVIFLALWINIAWLRRTTYRWLVMLLYFVTLAYYLYESIMRYLYGDEPVFYSHYFLVRDGLSFLFDHLHLPTGLYFIGIAAFLIAVGAIIAVLTLIVDTHLPTELSRVSRVMVIALAVAVSLSALFYRTASADPRMVVSSLTFKLEQNISASVSLYSSIARFNDKEIFATYDYTHQELAHRPNIYLLFIESYGSVLNKRPDYKIAYAAMQQQMQDALTAEGLLMASNMSESTTWGGGSWLAYTSVLFGLRMESHPQYLALMERYQTQILRYPDLGAYLRNQGYHYLVVTSIADELGDQTWDRYKRFYGVSEWLRYRDLGYDGMRYGWGPAPPDQYVLNYTRDVHAAAIDQPLFMFYITQNSHYPWDPMPSLVPDWRTLDLPSPTGDPLPTEAIDHVMTRQRYADAIDYQLEMLTDFILNHAEEDAIFVLIGDHQPPRVSRRDDGYETPVHIVSRDPAWIANLAQYGFVPGATPDPTATPIRHESIYSLLVRTLIQTYGTHPEDAPDYLPNGVTLPDWISSVAEPAPSE